MTQTQLSDARTGAPGDRRVPAGVDVDRGRQSIGFALDQPLVAQLDAELSWEQDARCRTHDPTLFFGPNRFEPKRERLARESEAKAVCATCPCIQACREHALATGELYGVWGGLGESDRRELLADRGSIATAV